MCLSLKLGCMVQWLFAITCFGAGFLGLRLLWVFFFAPFYPHICNLWILLLTFLYYVISFRRQLWISIRHGHTTVFEISLPVVRGRKGSEIGPVWRITFWQLWTGCVCFFLAENQYCQWGWAPLLLPSLHLCCWHREHPTGVQWLSRYHSANAPSPIRATVMCLAVVWPGQSHDVMHLCFSLSPCGLFQCKADWQAAPAVSTHPRTSTPHRMRAVRMLGHTETAIRVAPACACDYIIQAQWRGDG